MQFYFFRTKNILLFIGHFLFLATILCGQNFAQHRINMRWIAAACKRQSVNRALDGFGVVGVVVALAKSNRRCATNSNRT